MSQKRSTTGTVIVSLVVGLVIGAVGTLGYQAYQTTGEEVKRLTEDAAAEEQYGVGGPGAPSEGNENKSDDEQKETEKKDRTDVEEREENEKTNSVVTTGEGEAPFLLPSLTQPTVEEINDESTAYDYGAGNVISVVSGDTAEVARNTTEIASEETFLIDDVPAREVVTYSAKDGSAETMILIEQEDGTLIMIAGDEIFLQSVKEDLFF